MSYSQFSDYQVTKLLRENRVEISMAINKMFPFLHDLRDKQIITFEKFKEIEAIAKQKDTNKAVYRLLSWLEVNNLTTLHKFWDFLFKDYNLQKYPKLLPLQERLSKGSHMRSIQVGKQWYSPKDFETLGGLGRNKKWKTSIKCKGSTLQKCIQMGYLSCQRKSKMSRHKPGSPKNKDDVRLASQAALNHEDVSPEETFKRVYGKCIRTETKWCTPMEFEDLSDINKDLKYWKRDIRSKSETLGKLIQKGYLKLHKLHCDCEHCTPQFADQQEDNDDVCTVCKKGGHLICCDECPRTFHEQCFVSSFKQSEKWSCTFCKIRNLSEDKSGNEISNNDLFMQPMSPNQLMKCELALLQLLCNKESVCFKKDPCKTIPDYDSEIHKPMWLHKVKENLMAKNYLTVDAFRRDVHLIFQNCIKFNQGNQFEKIGRNLSKRFEENLRQIFSIS